MLLYNILYNILFLLTLIYASYEAYCKLHLTCIIPKLKIGCYKYKEKDKTYKPSKRTTNSKYKFPPTHMNVLGRRFFI